MSQVADETIHGSNAIHILDGADRWGEYRTTFGMPIAFKVASQDTDGSVLIIENITPRKGGPPRHLHPAQDEWFYVVQGEYTIEIDDQTYHLQPGDSLLAPRGVPHVWAYTGDATGKLLIIFQPAGQMEAFFQAMGQLDGPLPREEMAALFHEHGMTLVGPPLQVS
jgi:quercetin dioxygenase-like cupin family protein